MVCPQSRAREDAFDWGEITSMWSYISYEFKSGSQLQDIKFNGPMIGATFRW